jgi:phosphate transport system permease protein
MRTGSGGRHAAPGPTFIPTQPNNLTAYSQDPEPSVVPAPARTPVPQRRGDRIFSGAATGAGLTILAALAGVAIFLLIKSWPAITADSSELSGGKSLIDYIAPIAFGTVLSASIAFIVAVPLAVAVALYISYLAPRRIAQPISYLVDLLAAIPSVVYGLWGIAVLGPAAVGIQGWLADHVGWLPFFKGPASATGRTMLVVGLVLAVMILPIVTAVTREVFSQTPRKLREGALALGATRWEMIRMTVLPFGRSAIISASMLGLGRALGETMAVTIILSVGGGVSFNLISSENPSSIAANIALNFPESSGLAVNELIASGLALFAITLVVNMAARALIGKRVAV